MITSEQAQELGYLLDPCFQIVNTAGKPVTNGYIEIYLHGTRVKYYAFSDWNGSLHPFQIPLDSLGSNIVLADPANSYDVYVYNAFGTLLMSRYNVKVSAASGGSAAPVTSETVPAMFLGEYGQRVAVRENVTDFPLPLPKGDNNTYTHNADEIIDHIDEGGYYMYLKPGVFFVNATIRFRQSRDNIKNKVTNVKIFTGNGNWNEVNCNKLDCTGQHAEDDYNYIHCTFIRVNDSEDTDFGRFSSDILYFRPLVYDSSWEECCIQRLEIVKLNTIGGEGGQSYIPGDYVSIVGNVISVTGVLPESATGDFVKYEEFNTEIQNIHNEIDNLEITVQNATAQIVEQTTEIVTAVVEEVAPPMVTSIIEREFAGVTGDFATRDELESATGNLQDQIDNIEPGVQADWTEDDPEDPSYIQNKPSEEEVEFEEVDLSVYATKTELQSATSEIINVIETVTGNVPTGAVTHAELENATSVLQTEIENATAQIPSDVVTHTELETATANLQTEIETVTGDVIDTVTSMIPSDVVTHAELEAATANIPAQVQSDWTESDSSDPSYIQNKPNEEEVEFEELDLSNYATVSNVTALESELETVTADVLQQATGAIPAQVQSDWTESDSTVPAYIKHKPSEKILVEGQNVHITASGDYIVISADSGQVTGDYIERDELENVTSQIESEIENVTAQIPSDVVTQSELESATANVAAHIPSDVVTHSELETATANVASQIPSDVVTHDELEAVTADVLDQATGAIPAQVQSDWTQTVTGDPSYIKHKPDTLPLVAGNNVTINEVNGEIVISAQGGGGSVTGDFVVTSDLEAATAQIQAEIESVTASIPSTDNLATKAEVAAATGDIQADIETVSSMITPELPVVGGTGIGITETATEITIAVTGDYATPAELATATGNIQSEIETVTASIPELPDEEEVEFEDIDLSDYAPATAITEVKADIQTVSSAIPDTSDMATKTWVGNQGYLTSVPATYVTESELATATATVEADIPVVTGFATKSELTTGLNGKQSTLTGITDVQVVAALPASPVATVLYLIPEA